MVTIYYDTNSYSKGQSVCISASAVCLTKSSISQSDPNDPIGCSESSINHFAS